VRAIVWSLAAAALAAGCGDVTEKSALPASDVKADLAELARARVFFGHQSVGGNVLDGLTALAAENGVSLRVVEVPAGLDDGQPGLVHTKIGTNAQPATKCDAFGGFLAKDAGAPWDAAVLKFCYADLGDRTDIAPEQLLDLYKKMVASVRAARPGLTLIHSTIPLNSNGLGTGDRVKGLLGLGTSKDANNVRRNRFNDLLRAEYAGQPLFDVARAESTRSDGTRTGFKKDGQFFSSMAREFTSDGGHLSPQGKRWVAQEFARSVAAALRSRPAMADAHATTTGP
jgi:hypothetical protein